MYYFYLCTYVCSCVCLCQSIEEIFWLNAFSRCLLHFLQHEEQQAVAVCCCFNLYMNVCVYTYFLYFAWRLRIEWKKQIQNALLYTMSKYTHSFASNWGYFRMLFVSLYVRRHEHNCMCVSTCSFLIAHILSISMFNGKLQSSKPTIRHCHRLCERVWVRS